MSENQTRSAWQDIRLYSQEVDVRLLYAKVAVVFSCYGDYRSTLFGEALLKRWLTLVSAPYYIDKQGRTYKRLSAKALARVLERLADPRANADHYEYFHFKESGGLEIDEYALEIFFGTTPTSRGPNRVIATLPLAWIEDEKIDRLSDLFEDWVSAAPFQHATAGLGFNLGYGPEYEADVRRGMMAVGRRYLGIDVRTRPLEPMLLDKVKGPGWLMYLRNDLLERVGGFERLRTPEFVRLMAKPLEHGVLIRSSDRPPVGDANRGATDVAGLRLMNRLIKPLRQKEFVAPLSFGIDEVEGASWLARFDE